MNKRKMAQLYRLVTKDHLCPFGIKAKYLLEKEGYEVEDNHLTSKAEADQIKKKFEVKTTPQVLINDQRIGGYTDLRDHFYGKNNGGKLSGYQPIMLIFATTLLMALMITLRFHDFSIESVIQTFLATSMCALGILKLRDIESFSNQFVTYDLLGQRYVPYAYIYPFAETITGALMLGKFLIWLAAPVAIIVGSIGAISVIKAVYVDKRDLKCACVGGNSNVPLGFISLTENLAMLAMGLYMLNK